MKVLRRLLLPTATGIIALLYWEAHHEYVVRVILGFIIGSLILSVLGIKS